MRYGESCVETAAGAQMALVFSARKWDYHPHVMEASVIIMAIYQYLTCFSGPRGVFRQKEHYDAPVVLNDVQCRGTEASITQCPGATYGNFAFCSDIAVAQCEGKIL